MPKRRRLPASPKAGIQTLWRGTVRSNKNWTEGRLELVCRSRAGGERSLRVQLDICTGLLGAHTKWSRRRLERGGCLLTRQPGSVTAGPSFEKACVPKEKCLQGPVQRHHAGQRRVDLELSTLAHVTSALCNPSQSIQHPCPTSTKGKHNLNLFSVNNLERTWQSFNPDIFDSQKGPS